MDTPDGTRTHNLRLRRATPYPLGHRSYVNEPYIGHSVAFSVWTFKLQMGLSNLSLRRATPYPFGQQRCISELYIGYSVAFSVCVFKL